MLGENHNQYTVINADKYSPHITSSVCRRRLAGALHPNNLESMHENLQKQREAHASLRAGTCQGAPDNGPRLGRDLTCIPFDPGKHAPAISVHSGLLALIANLRHHSRTQRSLPKKLGPSLKRRYAPPRTEPS